MEEVFEAYKSLKIGVVGDIILDRYVLGDVERISPEAPVPVVEVRREEFRLGGSANVANNLASMGVKTYLIGLVGQDYGMHIVKGLLKERGIQDMTVQDPSRPTTEKTRILALSQQLIRIDREERTPPPEKVLRELLERLDQDFDAIIVSDYAKGVVCKTLMDRIREKRVFFSVDPRPANKYLYTGANLMTPNEKEAKQMAHAQGLEGLGFYLKEELQLETLTITLGPRGIALFKDNKVKYFPAKARQVYDVTGAGDTVIAILTATYTAGFDWDIACELANVCAGIVVSKLGTATVSHEEVMKYLEEG